MSQAYPPIRPYLTYHLDVGEGHSLYVEESGSSEGIPVLVLHGGPGAGSNPEHRRLFDPNKYRIVLFDQRGCGKSTPLSELAHNHTPALIEDIERLRQHCKVNQWVLMGSSWGSTLALLYAEKYPEYVQAMFLRSIFLARESDYRWLFVDGAPNIYPEAWAEFIAPISHDDRDRLIEVYYEFINDNNELTRLRYAQAWSKWHRACATLQPQSFEKEPVSLTVRLAMIETYFAKHRFFIEENEILNNAFRIRKIPTIIIHGRYDMITPVSNAYQLAEHLSSSKLTVVRNAGHAGSEPALKEAIVDATAHYAKGTTFH